jgi:proline iminopeptidase
MAQIPQDVKGYQHDEAWDVNWLRVDDVHELYYRQFGKKDGKPGNYLFSFKLHYFAMLV